MKITRFPIGMLVGSLAALVLHDRLAAQAVTPPSNRPELDEPFVLSPFVINSERDTGYQATSTLAGTRLNTPIKDLAASISIYTKDLLEDLGATNSSELLVFATGMEAAGPTGNISGNTNDINADRPTGEGVRVDPQSGVRTRGLATPTFTRGYFPTSIAFDSYNTTSVTVNRGPNAALFGVGSAAGVVDTALVGADLAGNKDKVTVRYGNNDAMRATLDLNRVLVPRKLATRFAFLWDDEKYSQRPAFEDKRRAYGAITFEPFKSTSLRGNFESGNTRANRPILSIPYNAVAGAWYAAGRPAYDWRYYDDPALNPTAASIAAGAATEGNLFNSRIVPQMGVFYSNPNDTAPSYGFTGSLTTTTANAANAVKSQLFHPLVNRDSATDTPRFLMTPSILDIPAAYWTGANVPPGQQPGYVPTGMKAQSFRDYSVFDWRNRMIDEMSRQSDSFHTFNLKLEQRAWQDRLGIELAYDRQRNDRHGRNSFFGNGNNNLVHVDVNATLPTGQPNPNLGRPFVIGNYLRMSDKYEAREGKRATAFLKYDGRDLGPSWGKWLGRHVVTGLYETAQLDSISTTWRYGVLGEASMSQAGNINANGRYFSPVVYVGPSIIGNNNPLKLEAIRIPAFTAGPVGSITYFKREANATDPGGFVSAPASIVDILQTGNGQREVIKSRAVVLQSNWLQDHVITTLGWRRDEDFFVRQDTIYVENPNDRMDPGKVHYGFNDFAFPSTPPPSVAEEIKSYGIILRWPQKLFRLPAGAQVSVFYNDSANFTPLGGRIDAYANPLPSPSGNTKEYGLNFSVWNERISLRFNRFETAIKDASLTPGFFGTATVNAVVQRAVGWATEGNLNPQLAAQRNADIELLFSALPANFRNLYGFQVTGTSPNIVASMRGGSLSGSGDTADYVAKGLEMDLVFNPTRNWRILLNASKQETVQSNSYPVLREFLARMKPVWEKLAHTPAGHYPTGFQPGDALPSNVQTYGQYLDLNVWVPWATSLATEGVASAEQRKWRANLVTNYTFRSGSIFGDRLKGFGIGAGVRWQDRLGLGYPSTRNPDGSVNVDIKHPYYAPSETNVNAWVSYERKLRHGLNWKVQLNVNNLIGNTELIGTSVQSWNGEVANYRLPPERRWYLSNTFSF